MLVKTFCTALDNELDVELHDGKGIACETFIPTICTAMLVKNAAQLMLAAGDESKVHGCDELPSLTTCRR